MGRVFTHIVYLQVCLVWVVLAQGWDSVPEHPGGPLEGEHWVPP